MISKPHWKLFDSRSGISRLRTGISWSSQNVLRFTFLKFLKHGIFKWKPKLFTTLSRCSGNWLSINWWCEIPKNVCSFDQMLGNSSLIQVLYYYVSLHKFSLFNEIKNILTCRHDIYFHLCENKRHSYPIFLERSLREHSIVPLYNLFLLPESDSLYSQSSIATPYFCV